MIKCTICNGNDFYITKFKKSKNKNPQEEPGTIIKMVLTFLWSSFTLIITCIAGYYIFINISEFAAVLLVTICISIGLSGILFLDKIGMKKNYSIRCKNCGDEVSCYEVE